MKSLNLYKAAVAFAIIVLSVGCKELKEGALNRVFPQECSTFEKPSVNTFDSAEQVKSRLVGQWIYCGHVGEFETVGTDDQSGLKIDNNLLWTVIDSQGKASKNPKEFGAFEIIDLGAVNGKGSFQVNFNSPTGTRILHPTFSKSGLSVNLNQMGWSNNYVKSASPIDPIPLDGKTFCRVVISDGGFGQPRGERTHCIAFSKGLATDGANTFFGNPPEYFAYNVTGDTVKFGNASYIISADQTQLTAILGSTLPGTVFTLRR
jgi:hypothetical protein